MPVLKNERHERFCQLKVEESVKSNPRSDAELYVQVGFAENGAAANARRLIRTDKRISARIKELGGLIGEAVTARVRPVIGQQVTSREGRVLMLADHLTDLYAIRDDRKSEQYKERYDQVPGAASGFMTVRAAVVGGRPVKESSFDRALALEIRATLQQIAMELGQWEEKSRVEVIDVLQAIEKADEKQLREAATKLREKRASLLPGGQVAPQVM